MYNDLDDRRRYDQANRRSRYEQADDGGEQHYDTGEDASAAVIKTVTAWVDAAGALQDVPGYDFDRMTPGNALCGPAIVWTPITTLVVAPGQTARVDAHRNLVIATRAGAGGSPAGAFAAGAA